MAVGALFAFPGMGFLAQCAPQTCADKPSSQECTPPYTVAHWNNINGVMTVTGVTATAGTQYLREAGQPLIRGAVVREGTNYWTYGPWSNADNVGGNLVSASHSVYPSRATAISYETSHS